MGEDRGAVMVFYHQWEPLRAHASTQLGLAHSLCQAGVPSQVCPVPETRVILTTMSLCHLAR